MQKTSNSFSALCKFAKLDSSGMASSKLAILGDCATQHLATALRGHAYTVGGRLDIMEADYNQIEAQTMDPQSELYKFKPNTTLIFMCVEKLHERFCGLSAADRRHFAQDTFEGISTLWARINSYIKTNVIQFTFVERDDRVFGNYACRTPDSFFFQVKKLNFLLMNGASSEKNVFLVDLNTIQARLGVTAFHDDRLYYMAKMPLSTDSLPHVVKSIMDTVLAFQGKFKKCVVLDLDNTLWGGVVGDDGLDGIQIGELGVGHAFSDLQAWLKELKNRGILLCVCSKNEEAAAKSPFLKHPEMVLRLDDISVFVANWENKADNIRHIQQTLNIGMDSMVFLDDSSFERNAVRSLIPEICVPELPEDPSAYLSFLQELNLFETVSYSEEDRDRTSQYQAEIGRTQLQKSYSSYDEYLQSLCMEAEARPFDAFHIPRIAQLSQRSNQFNLRTVRYTEKDIEAIAADGNRIHLYFTLKDKCGDYGLISVMIMNAQPDKSLFIENWLMSCRVLKRGMEEFIINTTVATARNAGFHKIIGEYLPTPKNAMVKDMYSRLGFSSIGEGRFVVDVDAYTPFRTYISITQGDPKK